MVFLWLILTWAGHRFAELPGGSTFRGEDGNNGYQIGQSN